MSFARAARYSIHYIVSCPFFWAYTTKIARAIVNAGAIGLYAGLIVAIPVGAIAGLHDGEITAMATVDVVGWYGIAIAVLAAIDVLARCYSRR
jgi:ABC-type antimicrobial peptide transport system permease subunit